MAIANSRLVLFPRIFTQGRLRCTQQHDSVHCLAGSNPGSYASGPPRGSLRRRTRPGLHGKRVVCPMPLERARNP